jgi:hypothetical protein
MPTNREPTPPHRLTARQIAEHLTSFYLRNRDRFAGEDREVLWELVRRVEQHERLVGDVVPDLRNRLTRLERALTAAAPACPARTPRCP